MQIRIDQEDSEVEFWMRFLGQLVIIPNSWQCVVFKLVCLHMKSGLTVFVTLSVLL